MNKMSESLYRMFAVYYVRQKLGLKKNEKFRFVNQKQKGVYWFTNSALIKKINKQETLSSVSFNFLLSDECKIVKL